MRLNCKVMKKWQTSHFYISPPSPFSDLSPLSNKKICTLPPPSPQVTQFWEGPTPPVPLPLVRGGGGGGGGGVQLCKKQLCLRSSSTIDKLIQI